MSETASHASAPEPKNIEDCPWCQDTKQGSTYKDCNCYYPCSNIYCPERPLESDDEWEANQSDIDWEPDEDDFEEDWVDEADEDGTLLEKVFPPIEK